jgi:electron transfer DM13
MTSDLKSPGRRRIGRGPLAVPASSLVVPVAAAVAAAAFFAWKPGVARSMLGSPRALGFTVLVGVLVLGLGWLLPRLGRSALVTMVAQAIPVLIAFVVTVLPAFHDVSVDEPFPIAAATAGARSSVPAVDRAAVVGLGRLQGIDHHASGDVLVVRSSHGYVVRLQSLNVEPGPDYHVHVVPGPGRQRPDGGTHLDRLRGNRGNQNYPVPATVGLQRPFTVLIWCRAFTVPIAAATIR